MMRSALTAALLTVLYAVVTCIDRGVAQSWTVFYVAALLILIAMRERGRVPS